jgi:hypothetical protein
MNNRTRFHVEVVALVALFVSVAVHAQSPTPLPTISCDDGYYLLSGSCTECPTGKYSNVNTSFTCKVCDPGYYANDVAKDKCVKCDAGKLANSDHTAW